jgi:hypothetical protein
MPGQRAPYGKNKRYESDVANWRRAHPDRLYRDRAPPRHGSSVEQLFAAADTAPNQLLSQLPSGYAILFGKPELS